MKPAYILTSLFLALYGFDLSYLERRGFIDQSILSVLSISDFIAITMILLVSIRPRVIGRYYRQVKFLPILLFVIFLTTAVAYLYVHVSGWYVPYSVEYRLVRQAISLLGSVVAGLLIGRLAVIRPQATVRALLTGLVIAFVGVFLQLYHDGFIGALANRLHGVNGEPKGLALFLVPYIVATGFVPILSIKRRVMVLAASVGIFLFTYSATGLLALAWCFLVLVLILGLAKTKRSLMLVIAIALFITYMLIAFPDLYDKIVGRIFDRAVGHFVEGVSVAVDIPGVGSVTVDGNDAPVLRMLLQHPILVLSGVGYGLQTVFSYPYLLQYKSGFIDTGYAGYITPNLAVLNNLPNIGLFLTIFLVSSTFASARKYYFNSTTVEGRFLLVFFLSQFVAALLVYSIYLSIIPSAIIISLLASQLNSFEKRVASV